MNFDTDNFEKLLEAKKFDEAKMLLIELMNAPLSQVEKGRIYTELAIAKKKLENAVNERYKTALTKVVGDMRKFQKAKTAVQDKIDLLEVRGKLAQ